MLHQSSGEGGEEPGQTAVAFLLGCWSVVWVVTSLRGRGVQCHCARQGPVAELCFTKVIIPRGQKFGGLGTLAHDFGVTRAVDYLWGLQGVWMDLFAGLWLISA